MYLAHSRHYLASCVGPTLCLVDTTISTKVFVSIFTTAISQRTGRPATLTKLKAPRVGRKNCHAFHSHRVTHTRNPQQSLFLSVSTWNHAQVRLSCPHCLARRGKFCVGFACCCVNVGDRYPIFGEYIYLLVFSYPVLKLPSCSELQLQLWKNL
jgi:hypothetical protein